MPQGYNHSGKGGQVNFLNGVMGYTNAQRALEYIRVITEFISQPQWKDVVVMFGVVNEPLYTTISGDTLSSLYVFKLTARRLSLSLDKQLFAGARHDAGDNR